MGQSSSRSRPRETTVETTPTTVTEESSSTNAASDAAVLAPLQHPAVPSSLAAAVTAKEITKTRRSSLRNSIAKITKPVARVKADDAREVSQTTRPKTDDMNSKRKSWRNSRLFSSPPSFKSKTTTDASPVVQANSEMTPISTPTSTLTPVGASSSGTTISATAPQVYPIVEAAVKAEDGVSNAGIPTAIAGPDVIERTVIPPVIAPSLSHDLPSPAPIPVCDAESQGESTTPELSLAHRLGLSGCSDSESATSAFSPPTDGHLSSYSANLNERSPEPSLDATSQLTAASTIESYHEHSPPVTAAAPSTLSQSLLNPSPSSPSASPSIPSLHVPHYSPHIPATTPATTTNSSALNTGHFPPPGTLVLVQGVVQTTEVPMPTNPDATSATSNPPSSQDRMASRHSNASFATSSVPHTPTHATGGGARNRQSAMVNPRGSRPPSVHSISTSTTAADATSSSSAQSSNTAGEGSPSASSVAGGMSPVPASDPPSFSSNPPAAMDQQQPHSTISSSSIEVLGTLLSVAAAATAASLLSGSSTEVPFSHSHPQSPLTSSSNPNFLSNPIAPSPTDFSQTIRRERMRQAWGSLRERLGLRASPSASPSSTPVVGSGSTTPGSPGRPSHSHRPMDAREIMLAEMARAFNVGLGLGGDGNPVEDSSSAEGQRRGIPGEPSLDLPTFNPAVPGAHAGEGGNDTPPEGSFERFLVDLQSDLRAALTGQSSPVLNSNPPDGAVSASSNDASEPVPGPSQSPAVEASLPSVSTARPATPIPGPSVLHISSRSSDRPDHDDEEEDEVNSIPDLASVSDSSEEDFDTSDDEEVQLPELPPISQQGPSTSSNNVRSSPGSSSPTTNTPNHNGPINADASRNINWWRMYRFSPITSPRPNAPSSTSTSPLATNSRQPPSHTRTSSLPGFSSVASTMPGRPFESTSPLQEGSDNPNAIHETNAGSSNGTATDNQQNIVYPIIVVGLRSVNVGRGASTAGGGPVNARDRTAEPAPSAMPMEEFGVHPDDTSIRHSMDSISAPTSDSDHSLGTTEDQDHTTGHRPPTPIPRDRDQPWHARAAHALRNLHHHRNGASGAGARRGSESAQQQQQDSANDGAGTGSRTFLIFVIGGYYPPDHSMVTGGPNSLGSFDALLELAEFLNQSKPATVSKEDIENSGLEIIKAGEMKRYEEEGKVSENCLDRCLICLDDYLDEDDVRLLSCRHGFHKDCVDRWLETGKNSCPACRSKGVNTDELNASSAMGST